MESRRFDALAQTFAARHSRRSALRRTGVGIAAALGVSTSHAVAQDATPDPVTDEKAFFLFVQTATAGSFTANPGAGTPTVDGTPVPGGGANYLLTLEGHPGGTVYFSDRPNRIFGEAPTQRFLDGLGFSPNNPPNAALVTQADDGTEEVVVLELLNPTWDEATGTVTYGATILDEYTGDSLAHVAAQQQAAMLPESFGRSSLFIDDCSDATAYCTTGFNYIGDIPGAIGMCWHFGDICCEPCNDDSTAGEEAYCNATYPDCNNNCYVAVDSSCT